MTSHHSTTSVTRRSALSGLGATGVGLALATTSRQAGAQDATPTAMAVHPMVGSWVVDRMPDDPTELPTTNIYHADGTLTDPTVGAAGGWEVTGERSLNFTLIVIFEQDGGFYALARGSVEVDEGGNTATGQAASTVVAPDGTVLGAEEPFAVRYIRIQVEPIEATGTPFEGFPAWEPTATPVS